MEVKFKCGDLVSTIDRKDDREKNAILEVVSVTQYENRVTVKAKNDTRGGVFQFDQDEIKIVEISIGDRFEVIDDILDNRYNGANVIYCHKLSGDSFDASLEDGSTRTMFLGEIRKIDSLPFVEDSKVIVLRDLGYAQTSVKKGSIGTVMSIGSVVASVVLEKDDEDYSDDVCRTSFEKIRLIQLSDLAVLSNPEVKTEDDIKTASIECDFKVGDRVKLTGDYDNARVGMIGTVKGFGRVTENIAVEFYEEFKGGHDCKGKTKPKRGHWIDPEYLKLFKEEFKVGDRIQVIEDCDFAKIGMTGVIKSVDTVDTARGFKLFAVEFDKEFKGGHRCGKITAEKRGQWIETESMALLKEEPNVRIQVGDLVADEEGLVWKVSNLIKSAYLTENICRLEAIRSDKKATCFESKLQLIGKSI